MKFWLIFVMVFSGFSSALEFVGDTHYEENCYFAGWNCHKVSKEEKDHLLQLFEEQASTYLNYFKNGNNLSNTMSNSIYEKASAICQKIYLLDPDSEECNLMHCAMQKKRWYGDDKSFQKTYKKECK